MRHLGIALAAAAMLFAVPALAQTPNAPSFKPGHAMPHMDHVTGQLTKIDGKALTIRATVEGQAKDTVVICDASTRIQKTQARGAGAAPNAPKAGVHNMPGRPMKFADLKVGQQVIVTYITGNNSARAIVVTPDAAAAGSPASGAEGAGTTK